MVTLEKNLTNENVMDLIFEAWREKEQNGFVTAKCSECGDVIDIDILGNSAKSKCSCGLMNRKLRGI